MMKEVENKKRESDGEKNETNDYVKYLVFWQICQQTSTICWYTKSQLMSNQRVGGKQNKSLSMTEEEENQHMSNRFSQSIVASRLNEK